MKQHYAVPVATFLFLSMALSMPIHAQVQNALHFDAVDDRVDCGTDASVNITGTHLSIEAWIYPMSFGPTIFSGNIVNKEDAAWSGFMMRCGAFGQLNMAVGNGVDWYELDSPQNVLVLNAWQHVAATYDGAFQRLYVNGGQVASTPQTVPIAAAVNPLMLGDWNVNANHRYFNGKMDEVRLWNITLDAATIAEMYHDEYCGPQTGLVAYYKFNQGIGGGDNTTITTITDEVGPNTGTLSGFELFGDLSNFVGGVVLGTSVNEVLCPDETYLFNGQELSEPGTYTATFPVPGSCDSTVVLTLTESSVNVGVAQNVNLLLALANGAQYQWINCATQQPIANATGQYYTAFSVGEYAVIVTQNGCSDTSACYSVTAVGIEELEAPSVQVWPQPANDRLNIELSVPVQRAALRILDMTGRVVHSRSLSTTQRTTVDVADLVTGAYFLEMQVGSARSTTRFLKE